MNDIVERQLNSNMELSERLLCFHDYSSNIRVNCMMHILASIWIRIKSNSCKVTHTSVSVCVLHFNLLCDVNSSLKVEQFFSNLDICQVLECGVGCILRTKYMKKKKTELFSECRKWSGSCWRCCWQVEGWNDGSPAWIDFHETCKNKCKYW